MSFYFGQNKFFSLSFQDPSFSLLLHDKLQVPNSSRRAWNERDSRCDVCATHLTQLKQEAVRLVLTLDQWDLSPTSSPPGLSGQYGPVGASGSREWPPSVLPSSSSSAVAAVSYPPPTSAQSPSPSPSQTPTPSPSHGPANPSCSPPNQHLQSPGHRQGSKPSSLGLGCGPERRNGSQAPAKAAQQQPVTHSPGTNSGNNGTVLSTAALQTHQHLSRANGGVALYPYQVGYES